MSGTIQDFDKITPDELKGLAPLGSERITEIIEKYFGTEEDDSGVLAIFAQTDYNPQYLASAPSEIYTAGFVTALAVMEARQNGGN